MFVGDNYSLVTLRRDVCPDGVIVCLMLCRRDVTDRTQ